MKKLITLIALYSLNCNAQEQTPKKDTTQPKVIGQYIDIKVAKPQFDTMFSVLQNTVDIIPHGIAAYNILLTNAKVVNIYDTTKMESNVKENKRKSKSN